MSAPAQELLRLLRRLGTPSGPELARSLGVSQPQLSRLLRGLGDQVCRMGRARATRYAATRRIEPLGTRIPVRRVDEAGSLQPVGDLVLLEGGRHYLDRVHGDPELFDGLPPFVEDMSPQGFLGRAFGARFPDLGLPPRPSDWTGDQCLTALARRGEDCVGDLILGDESLTRFLSEPLAEVERGMYPALAAGALERPAGSSAGGEHPKFLAFVEGRHVLVKFSPPDGSPAARRWRDLLACEALALVQLREAGIPAALPRCLDLEGMRFLEVERFDRVGPRGRRGLLSLGAWDDAYLGKGVTWSQGAREMNALGALGDGDARRVRWYDVFGQLIGNTDQHRGNLSFFADVNDYGRLTLAPAYDVLPMLFAPSDSRVVEREYVPAPPTAETLDVWAEAARAALQFWSRVAASDLVSGEFRARAERCRTLLDALVQRVGPLAQ